MNSINLGKNEKWLPVVGFENAYEVSDHGNVRSKTRTIEFYNSYTGRVQQITRIGQPLKPKSNYLPSGRLRNLEVSLSEDARSYSFTVHKLVMAAFVGPRPNGLDIAHADSNPANNCLSNLRYCTHISNCHDRKLNGTHPAGAANPASKLDDLAVLAIRALKGIESAISLARTYNVSRFCINDIQSRKTWSHLPEEIF